MNPVHPAFPVPLSFVLIHSSVVLEYCSYFYRQVCLIQLHMHFSRYHACHVTCLSLAQQPQSGLGGLVVEVSRSRAQTHETPDRTPLNEWSAHRRGCCLHNTQQADEHFCPPSGVRTCDPHNQAAADLHLRPHGGRDLLPALFSSGNPYSFQRNVKVVKLLTQFSSLFLHFRLPILDQ
jgi:hypothetical protein